jgi:MFS family permease
MGETIAATAPVGFLSRERTIAKPSFNRWLVPPAALAIHLCIGMAYGFSVFWLPLSRAVGIAKPVACSPDQTFIDSLTSTGCDWKVTSLQFMYTLFFIFLGCSAALFGGWLERSGPRKGGVAAAFLWCGGLILAALGTSTHQIWLLWLSGCVGGVGLGIGYITPVSTLVKWFPDRRGMATGMAIMGFGGGAMIGSPFANYLITNFRTETDVGVWPTFLVLAAVYFIFMIGGALLFRVPPENWAPAGWVKPAETSKKMVTDRNVHVDEALKTPQFWLIWWVLCLNVTAGIGIIGMASPMLQEVFGGHLIGVDAGFNDLTPDQKTQIAAIGAGFAGLLSLFNIAGRFFWASLSDKLGRKNTYFTFFILGMALYGSVPTWAQSTSLALFVLSVCIILSMYGGGFATVPAYLADMFGTKMVGAIHGRLLTAWSMAGIFGPTLVGYVRDYQLDHGVPRAQVYNITMYVLVALLLIGAICNYLVKSVAEKHYMTAAQEAAEVKPLAAATGVVAEAGEGAASWQLPVAWLVVGLPLAWGIWKTLQTAAKLFS